MKRFLEFINENKNTMRLYYSDKLRTLLTKITNGSSEEAKKIANFLNDKKIDVIFDIGSHKGEFLKAILKKINIMQLLY
jgi:predicted RNase H-related nuclease YkuK (DUF458 family)